MSLKLYTSAFFFFLIFQPFLIRIEARRTLNELEISNQFRSDSKNSKFLFSTNVIFEDGGLNEKFYCLADCLKKSSSIEENDDEKYLTVNSELLKRGLPFARVSTNPQPVKRLSDKLLLNIGLNKYTKASPFYGHDGGAPHLPRNAIDGDQVSSYISMHIPNPWWIVELGDTYKIVKISFYSRPGLGVRSIGVQFYVADYIPFLCNGNPDISNLTVFGERTSIPLGTDKSDHEVKEGHYGSKVMVYKPTHNTHLEIVELQINGYLYV